MKSVYVAAAVLSGAFAFGQDAMRMLSDIQRKTNPIAEAAPQVTVENARPAMKRFVWLRSIFEARQLAEKEKKLVLWFHVVGDLDGVT